MAKKRWGIGRGVESARPGTDKWSPVWGVNAAGLEEFIVSGEGAGDEFVGRLACFEAGFGEGEDVVRLNVGDTGDAVLEARGGRGLIPGKFEGVGDEPVGAFIDGGAKAFGAENRGDAAGAEDHDRAGELNEAAKDDEFTDGGAAIPGHAGAIPAAHVADADGSGGCGRRAQAIGGGM